MGNIKTGIVIESCGPASLDEVGPFLLELFADREIINCPSSAGSGRTSRAGALLK